MPARLILILATGAAILVGVTAWVVTQRAPYGMVHIRLPGGEGLREGSAVTYLGIEIGRIERIEFTADSDGTPQVALALRLTRRDAPLRAGDTASVRSQGPLGQQSLSILPGPPTARRLVAGDTLVVKGRPRVESRDLLDAIESAAVRQRAESVKARSTGEPPPPVRR